MSDPKRCANCGKNFSVSEFNLNSIKPDGLQSQCRTCGRARSTAYYRRRRQAHKRVTSKNREAVRRANQLRLLTLLQALSCVDCGESDPLVLDFDHVRPGKTGNISRMVATGFSWKRILDEIAMCEVRCANCHRRKTAREQRHYKWILALPKKTA